MYMDIYYHVCMYVCMQVLQKERDVLMSAVHSPGNDLPPDYQQLLQNQVKCNGCNMLCLMCVHGCPGAPEGECVHVMIDHVASNMLYFCVCVWVIAVLQQ